MAVSVGVFLFGDGTDRLQSQLEPGHWERYLKPKLALSELVCHHDRLHVEGAGEDRWTVDCWDFARCEPCEGTGRDPERDPHRCRACNGAGRDRHSELTLTCTYGLDLEGELTATSNEERSAA